jgi:hypothetical protein
MIHGGERFRGFGGFRSGQGGSPPREAFGGSVHLGPIQRRDGVLKVAILQGRALYLAVGVQMSSKGSRLIRNIPRPEAEEEKDRDIETRSDSEPVLVRKLDRRLLHQPQGPDSGINAIIGRWPGDESDEEIIALLDELS